MKINSEVRRT